MALHPSSVSCHPQGLSQPFLVPRGHSVLASIGTRTANICIHSLLRGKTCSISDRGDTMPLNIIPVSLLTNALKLSVLIVQNINLPSLLGTYIIIFIFVSQYQLNLWKHIFHSVLTPFFLPFHAFSFFLFISSFFLSLLHFSLILKS